MHLEPVAAFHEGPADGKEQNRNQHEEHVQHFFTYAMCISATLWPSWARERASFSSSVRQKCRWVATNTVEAGFKANRNPSSRSRASTTWGWTGSAQWLARD